MGGLRRYHDEHDCHPRLARRGHAHSSAAWPAMPSLTMRPATSSYPFDGSSCSKSTILLSGCVFCTSSWRLSGPNQRSRCSTPPSSVTRRLPRSVQAGVLGGFMPAVDVVTSNVPGVAFPLYLAGAGMEAQYPFDRGAATAVNVTAAPATSTSCSVGVNTETCRGTGSGGVHGLPAGRILRRGLEGPRDRPSSARGVACHETGINSVRHELDPHRSARESCASSIDVGASGTPSAPRFASAMLGGCRRWSGLSTRGQSATLWRCTTSRPWTTGTGP